MQYEDGNLSPLKAFFRNKWVWLILAIDAIVIIAIIVASVIKSSKTSVIKFNVAPIDAQISVNGSNKYNNGESYYFAPGTYEITISHDNLDSKTLSINLEPNHSLTLSTFLKNQEDDFTFYTLRDNYVSFEILEEIASKENNLTIDQDTSAEDFIKNFQKNYQIFDILPIIDQAPSKYGLDYGANYAYETLQILDGHTSSEECTQTLCLLITDTSGEKEAFALSVLDSLGFNHEAYQIIYQKVDYE